MRIKAHAKAGSADSRKLRRPQQESGKVDRPEVGAGGRCSKSFRSQTPSKQRAKSATERDGKDLL